MESGVALSPWATDLPADTISPRQRAQDLASRVGCGSSVTEGSAAMVDCLKGVSMVALLAATQALDARVVLYMLLLFCM